MFSFLFPFLHLLMNLPPPHPKECPSFFLGALVLFVSTPFLLLQHEINSLLYHPTASPPPFYLASSPLLAVASHFAVLFEQILILPAQLFFPLWPSCACSILFFSTHLQSERLCPLLQNKQPHSDLTCPALNFHFLHETFPLDFINLVYFQVLKYSTF